MTHYGNQKVMVAARQMAEKKVCASIIAHGEAAPILETAEHVLDAAVLPAEGVVAGERQPSGCALMECRAPCRAGSGLVGSDRCHSLDRRSGDGLAEGLKEAWPHPCGRLAACGQQGTVRNSV
jgi:hypothetical protein